MNKKNKNKPKSKSKTSTSKSRHKKRKRTSKSKPDKKSKSASESESDTNKKKPRKKPSPRHDKKSQSKNRSTTKPHKQEASDTDNDESKNEPGFEPVRLDDKYFKDKKKNKMTIISIHDIAAPREITTTIYEIGCDIENFAHTLIEDNQRYLEDLLSDTDVVDAFNLLITLNLRETGLIKQLLMSWCDSLKSKLNWNTTSFSITPQLMDTNPILLDWLTNTPAHMSWEQLCRSFELSGLAQHISMSLEIMLQHFETLNKINIKEPISLQCSLVDFGMDISDNFKLHISDKIVWMMNWFFSSQSILNVVSLNGVLEIKHTPFFYDATVEIKSYFFIYILFSSLNLSFLKDLFVFLLLFLSVSNPKYSNLNYR